MIKFKNIIRKAKGPTGHTGTMAAMFMGFRTAAPEAEAAPTPTEEPQETVAEVTGKIASAPPAAFPAERREVPPEPETTGEVLSPPAESEETPAALDEHPTPAPSEPEEPSFEITDQLVDSVLDDIFPEGDGEDNTEEPAAETAPSPEKDAPVDSAPAVRETAPEMEEPASLPEPRSFVATDEPPAPADDSAPTESAETEKSTEEVATEEAAGKTEDASGADSVMEDVDRLLAELGQLATPDTRQTPSEDAAQEAPAAEEPHAEPQPDEAFAQTLTDDEKEALFADDSDAEAFDTDALVDTITAEVDQALLQEQSAPPPKASVEAEIELDFSAEAVGLEQESNAQDSEQDDSDIEGLLSKVLEDLDRLGTVEKAPRPPADEDEDPDDDTFERMLREDTEPDDDDPALSSPAQSTAKGAAAAPPDVPKPPTAKKTEEQSEDEIVAQAIEETLGKTPSTGGSDDDSHDDEPSSPADAKRSALKGGDGGDSEETEDIDMLLANLEATMEAPAKPPQADDLQLPRHDDAADDLPDMSAAEEEDPADSPPSDEDQEESLIRQEVLSRSKDVEQAVLDQLFGGDTEQFRENLKADLELIDQDRGNARQAASMPLPGSPPPGENIDESAPADRRAIKMPELSKNVRFALHWFAYQMNKPFARWLNPARRKLLGAFSLGLICTGFFWLAAVLMLRIVGR